MVRMQSVSEEGKRPEDFNVVVASPLWAQGAYGGLV
jgi:hypothetical protein